MNCNNNDSEKIYLDYNATTPLAKEVITNVCESLVHDWGNPSSSHAYGQMAKKSVANARNQIAKMLGGESAEIIFTSGGTEANNMIILGILHYSKEYQVLNGSNSFRKPHIITSNVEHDSILLPIKQLEKQMLIECSIVKVNDRGIVDVDAVMEKIKENTCLITIMAANNETGIIMPISKIGKRLKEINAKRESNKMIRVLFHTDAAQIIGKEKVNVDDLHVDYLTVVGHKFYGPRNGCIWAKGPLYPIFHGGGQESNLRPGTENTPMIVGLGAAAELVALNVEKYKEHMLACRGYLERRLVEVFGDGVKINCGEDLRLPNTSNVSFVGDGLFGNSILKECQRVIASVGAACHGGLCSQILINSGVSVHLARNAIRLSVGRDTTIDDIDAVVEDLAQAVNKLKSRIV